MASLPEVFKKTSSFLTKYNFDYLVIGGVAAAVLGNPRMTEDVDICLFIKRTEIKDFLKKVKREGFKFNEREIIKRVNETGTFQILFGEFHIDFLILSTDFEKSALSRKQFVKIYGIAAPLPTPEDMILFKVIPARHIDLWDAENIALRYSGRLDKNYLKKWAMKLSDEAENMKIYNEVQRLIKL
ncbi:MAG TPA: DUF6036 family nucleotidyltransferase [bacterium]